MRFILASVAALTLGIGVSIPAFGVSPSQQECEAVGGTFTRVNGEVQCVQEEHVGNSDNSQTTTSTTTGQGNIDNKTESECSGPGNSASSAHCR